MVKIETRSLSECRADGNKLVGLAVVYNKLSQKMDLGLGRGFFEKFDPGAFTRSISGGEDVRALREHDSMQILGRVANNTLRLSEDERGVHVEIETPDTLAGHETLKLVKRGDLRGMSFSFMPHDGSADDFDDWDDRENGDVVRTVRTAKLVEVSVVSDPAYLETAIAVRSLDSWRSRRLFSQGAARSRELDLVRMGW